MHLLFDSEWIFSTQYFNENTDRHIGKILVTHVGVSGGFKVGGARGKTKKGGPSDDVIVLSQPW